MMWFLSYDIVDKLDEVSTKFQKQLIKTGVSKIKKSNTFRKFLIWYYAKFLIFS